MATFAATPLRGRGLNSGEDRSFAIRSESSSLRLRTTNKRSSLARSIWPALRTSAAIGPSCATAEWEPHAATWLAWPHFRGDWPGKFDPIPWVYAEVIRNLAPHERVELVVPDAATEAKARKILDKADALSPNLRFHRWKTDRIWTR